MLGRHLLRFTAAAYKPLSEYIPSDIPDSYYVVVSDDELLIRKSFSMELPPAKYLFAGCGGGGNSGGNGDRGWNYVRGGGGGGSSPLVEKNNYVLNTEKLFSFTVGNNTKRTAIAIGSTEILVASAGQSGSRDTPGAGGGYGTTRGNRGGNGTTYISGLPGGGTMGTYHDVGGGGGGAGSQFPYVIEVGKTVKAADGWTSRYADGYGGTGFGAGGGGYSGCYDYNCSGRVSAGAPGAIYIKRYK
jgi:hypothetical protein